VTLERGFRSRVLALGLEVRSEIGLSAVDVLDPLELASWLGIPVVALSTLSQHASAAVAHLTAVNPSVFSAVTVFAGPRRVIVHNDAHAPTRQRSNLAHELCHGLLLHPPTPPLETTGINAAEADYEEEAAWFAGALLIPDAAALAIARNYWTNVEAAEHFGLSEHMVAFRMNTTAARRRVDRSRARHAAKRAS
jgi:Zn-dependent peptidase ImmA (M78 family)